MIDDEESGDEEAESDAADAEDEEVRKPAEDKKELVRGTSPEQGAEDRIYRGNFNSETPFLMRLLEIKKILSKRNKRNGISFRIKRLIN